MTGTPDDTSNGTRQAQKKGRLSITMVLDALLSVTFLVLAAYIGFYASAMTDKNGRDLFWFSILLGAYGVWRAIRSLIRHRRRDEES
jgi:hypothetical protein